MMNAGGDRQGVGRASLWGQSSDRACGWQQQARPPSFPRAAVVRLLRSAPHPGVRPLSWASSLTCPCCVQDGNGILDTSRHVLPWPSLL